MKVLRLRNKKIVLFNTNTSNTTFLSNPLNDTKPLDQSQEEE